MAKRPRASYFADWWWIFRRQTYAAKSRPPCHVDNHRSDDFEDVEGPSHGSDRADERLPELGFFDLIVVVDSLRRLPRRLCLRISQRGLPPTVC